MANDALSRLLEAEKEAQSMFDQARSDARKIIAKAEEKSLQDHRSRIERFQSRRKSELEDSTKSAIKEAERIKRDGIEIAKGLAGRSKERIPLAVEEILEQLKNGF